VTTAKGTREAEIQRQIEEALGAEPDLLLLRNSVGRAEYVSETGQQYTVPYGLGVGSPDLVGMLAVPGRELAAWFCIEVKRPAEEPTPHQTKCHGIWRRFRALVYVCCSVDEARAALADARARVAQ
jgi:hypothetical protein